jgi:hypothetical protein
MKEDIIFQLLQRRGEKGNVVKTSGKELLLKDFISEVCPINRLLQERH